MLPQIQKIIPTDENYQLVTTAEELEAVRLELEAASLIAVDTETEGLAFDDLIVGICLSTKPGTGYYIPMRHEEYDGALYEDQLPPEQVYDALKFLLETKPCVGHNIKFDWKMLAKDGVNCNFVHDTLVIAKLMGNYTSNGLKFLVKYHFKHDMADLLSLFKTGGSKKAQIRPKLLSPKEICHYAVEDANWTLQLFYLFEKAWPRALGDYLYIVEMKLVPIVGEMEMFGLLADKSFLREQGAEAVSILERLEKEITESIRKRLNDPEYTIKLNSPLQLRKLLFEDLGLPVVDRTPKGAPSTSGEVLEHLAEMDTITRTIHTYRTLKKLNSTYLAGLVPQIQSDGRIRANFNQLGAATGRFTCSEPNLQNLPRDQSMYLWGADNSQLVVDEFGDPEKLRASAGAWEIFDKHKNKWGSQGELGQGSDGKLYGVQDSQLVEMWYCKTRNFVVAPPDHYLVESDFSQVELRILAGESGEKTLLEAYANNDDVHQATAAAIFGVAFEDVTEEQRHTGKTINFSLLYGAGAGNIAKQLGISESEAETLIARYFQNLPEIEGWIQATKKKAQEQGMAFTPLKRRRVFPLIRSGNGLAEAAEKRQAVNFKIQGAAADVMKVALVRTHGRLKKYFGDKVRMVSTVHDSIVIEAHNSVPIEDLMAVLKHSMTEFTPRMSAKWPELKIDIKKGTEWANTEKVAWLDEVVMPPESDEEVPNVRVRIVAREREFGVGQANSTEDQMDIFSGIAARPKPSGETISWVIETTKALNSTQLNGLTEFLQERFDKEAGGTVKVFSPDESGEVSETKVNGTFHILVEDRTALRIKIGSCSLRQELDEIDPDVLKGVDFGL